MLLIIKSQEFVILTRLKKSYLLNNICQTDIKVSKDQECTYAWKA